MYMEDDTLTPRDRISDDMLQRILGETDNRGSEPMTTEEDHCYQNDSMRNDRNRPNQSTRHTWGIDGHPLAMVYAPVQNFHHLYDRDTALKKGTIFSELDLPFEGASVAKGGGCCD